MAHHGIPVYNLPLLREWRGLTQGRLATVLDCNPGTVWNWEHGVSAPRPAMLLALSRALGVSEPILRMPDPLVALTVARVCDPWPVTAGGVLRWEALVRRLHTAA